MLTQEQLDDIISGYGLKDKPATVTPRAEAGVKEELRGKAFLSTLKTNVKTPQMEEASKKASLDNLIGRLKSDLETKFSEGKIGGSLEEKSDRMKENVASKIKGDIGNMGEVLSEGAGEILKAVPREMVRPFISFVQGIQGLVPGGKTGEEEIIVPGLGEVKNYTKLTPGEALLGASSLAPIAAKPIAKAGSVVANKVATPARVVAGKVRGSKTTLESLISPKTTITRRGELINQGLVTKGEKFPLLGKAPDVIKAGPKEKAVADTYRKYISNADSLDEFQLVTKAKESIKVISDKVRPVLNKIPLKDESKKDILDKANTLISKQREEPLFLTNKASNTAFQRQFREFIGKTKDVKNLEELWDLRIKYDDIVPAKIKNATESSSELLQQQQDMWLQNREVLNDWIIQKVGRQDFLDMSRLYDGMENIIRKGNVDTIGTPSAMGNLFPKTRLIK